MSDFDQCKKVCIIFDTHVLVWFNQLRTKIYKYNDSHNCSEIIITIKMSWKCDFCPQRIFTTKTSYTNHMKQCLKSVESSEELSLDIMIIDSFERLNNEV